MAVLAVEMPAVDSRIAANTQSLEAAAMIAKVRENIANYQLFPQPQPQYSEAEVEEATKLVQKLLIDDFNAKAKEMLFKGDSNKLYIKKAAVEEIMREQIPILVKQFLAMKKAGPDVTTPQVPSRFWAGLYTLYAEPYNYTMGQYSDADYYEINWFSPDMVRTSILTENADGYFEFSKGIGYIYFQGAGLFNFTDIQPYIPLPDMCVKYTIPGGPTNKDLVDFSAAYYSRTVLFNSNLANEINKTYLTTAGGSQEAQVWTYPNVDDGDNRNELSNILIAFKTAPTAPVPNLINTFFNFVPYSGYRTFKLPNFYTAGCVPPEAIGVRVEFRGFTPRLVSIIPGLEFRFAKRPISNERRAQLHASFMKSQMIADRLMGTNYATS